MNDRHIGVHLVKVDGIRGDRKQLAHDAQPGLRAILLRHYR